MNEMREDDTIIGQRRIRWIVFFLIAIGVGILIISRLHSKPLLTKSISKEIPIRVHVHRVTLYPFQEEIAGVATLRAKVCCLLSSNVSGNVSQILSDIGSQVKTGQVLCYLDPTHYELTVRQAQAALTTAQAGLEDLMAWSRPEDIAALKAKSAQAKIQLKDAERNYKRLQSLHKEKAVAESRLESVEASYKAALYAFQAAEENVKKAQAGPTPAALKLAQSQVRQARESLNQAKQRLHDTTIRTPIDGDVVTRAVELGQIISPGMLLFKIVNNKILVADVDITEKAHGHIQVGMAAEVHVDALPDPVFSGTVSAVNAMVNPRVHTFTVRVEMDNPTGELIDGMFCRVRLHTGKRSALAVPRTALLRTVNPEGDYVFLVENGKAVKKSIKTGSRQDDYVEVLEGLAVGDMVVMSGTDRIEQGKAVEIKN